MNLTWDTCHDCRVKDGEIEHMQCQLDNIRENVEYYQRERDHWDWDNLINDILAVLDK